MKKLLCLIVVFVLLLTGCSGKKVYYSSPLEAFEEFQQNNVEVNRELEVINISNELVIYAAVTTDIVRSGCVMTAVMEKKEGRFRVAEKGGAEHFKLTEVEQKDFSESSWSHFVTEDGNRHYMWQWVASEKAPENSDGAYTFNSYEFEYAGTDYGLTLVLYAL